MSEQLPPPTGAPIEPAAPTAGTPKIIVWAFILSLAGFLILTALAAVAMVLTKWKQIQASGKGKGLAIATLIISGFWIVIMVFAVLSPSDEAAESVGSDAVEVIDEAPEPEVVSVAEAVLRMGVTDETTTGIPEDFEVWVRGTGSWFYAQDSLIEEAGPFAVGQPVSFFIYPQGRESTEIEVSLVLSDDVIAGSVRDLITIAVSDTDVTVSGTSVPDFEATFPRLAAELVAEPTLDQVEACIVAWAAENRADRAGTLDDATLRATAYDCPDYETWVFIRDEVGYGNTSPNLLRALCALEAESPVCKDAKRLEVL